MNDSAIQIISHTTTTSMHMLIATVTTKKIFGVIPVHFESALLYLEHRQYFTKT